MKNFLILTLLIAISCSCSRPIYVQKSSPQVFVEHPFKTKPEFQAQKGLVIIDPGHGGEDLGTNSSEKPNYQEKHLTLSTSLMVKRFLEEMGYAVIMTRTKDIFIDKHKRAEFANTTNADLFVSIHYNSAPNKEAKGIEIFYYKTKEEQERSDKSFKLANAILNKALEYTEANSRGVKHGSLAVIRQTKMPAVLFEGGFLTNSEEVKNLKNGVYLKKIAWGIAQGIDDYFTTNEL